MYDVGVMSDRGKGAGRKMELFGGGGFSYRTCRYALDCSGIGMQPAYHVTNVTIFCINPLFGPEYLAGYGL
jgi:hypothetical protein